jgi:hypothetical protein
MSPYPTERNRPDEALTYMLDCARAGAPLSPEGLEHICLLQDDPRELYRRYISALGAENLPTPDDLARHSEAGAIPRNDVDAAMRWFRVWRGRIGRESEMVIQLFDDPAPLLRRLSDEGF